jgi:hypothetical protein
MVAPGPSSSSFAQAPQIQMAETTFFPYMPGCTKRRKRTPAHARKVLEEAFERDTKPNGAQRQMLAEELDMTPRNVQVSTLIGLYPRSRFMPPHDVSEMPEVNSRVVDVYD